MAISIEQKILQEVTPEREEAFKRLICRNKEALFWIDLELTGLDLAKDKIVEVATVASDMHLTTFVKGPNVIVNPELERDYELTLSPWCEQTFATNGLAGEILLSRDSYITAEEKICEFIQALGVEEITWYLAGSSVHVDRQFLCQEMPKLIGLLTYRIIDVSSLAVLAWRWSPMRMQKLKTATKYSSHCSSRAEMRDQQFLRSLGMKKKSVDSDDDANLVKAAQSEHRAQYDIVRSITLLRIIKDNVLRSS